MSTYTFELLPDEPIVLVTATADYSPAKDGIAVGEEVMAIGKPIFLIIDMRDKVFSVDDIITSANQRTPETGSILKHPNVLGTVFVTNSKIVKLAVEGIATPIFGNISVRITDTVEDALALARSVIA